MAPSNKLTLIALLVAFAMVAPMLPISAAARDGGRPSKAAAAPALAPSGEEVLHPRGFLDDIIGDIGDIIGWIPDLPLPRILPCPPAFPKIPLIPCDRPPVAECRPSLAKYMSPCAGYLTNTSVPSPSSKCCAAIDPFFDDKSTTPLCLCHVVNGDVGEVWKAPVNAARANSFLQQCGFELSAENVTMICSKDKVFNIPPMDAPTPSPAPSQ